MKKTIIQALTFLMPIIVSAQDSLTTPQIKRNTIYLEVYGQGLYNSFTFDRLYNLEKKVKNSFSAGLTIIPHPELFVLATPVSYNYIFGQKNHHLELGLGFTAMYIRNRFESSQTYRNDQGALQTDDFTVHSNDYYTFFTPKISYRFQKPSGGIFFRLSLNPTIAAINRIGKTSGGKYNDYFSRTEYFTNAAFFPFPVMPWPGISFGWTLKK